MLVIYISSDYLCWHMKAKGNMNGIAIFVIVIDERSAPFYRIFDRHNFPVSEITNKRPTWTWISMTEM